MRTMSSETTRRAPPSQGGLARLVSRFENLDASPRPRSKYGAAQKDRGRPAVTSRIPGPSSVQRESKRTATEIPRSVTVPSLASKNAPPVKSGSLKTPVKDRHARKAVTPSSTGGKLTLQKGSVVAQRRKLFEQGPDENVAPSE